MSRFSIYNTTYVKIFYIKYYHLLKSLLTTPYLRSQLDQHASSLYLIGYGSILVFLEQSRGATELTHLANNFNYDTSKTKANQTILWSGGQSFQQLLTGFDVNAVDSNKPIKSIHICSRMWSVFYIAIISLMPDIIHFGHPSCSSPPVSNMNKMGKLERTLQLLPVSYYHQCLHFVSTIYGVCNVTVLLHVCSSALYLCN